MNPWWVTAIAGVVYGCASFLAIQLGGAVCAKVVPFADGPRPGRPPVVMLVAGSAICGASLSVRGADVPSLGLAGLLVAALAACWYSDVRCGIVPDMFTLVPLGIVLAIAVLMRNPAPFVAATVVFVPFAVAAALSHGRGMGWGDVKLVALGAAVLPLQSAMLAFSGACIVAVVVAAARRKRTEPVAFAPYLSAAMAVTLAFPVFPQ
jgi:prepilin signal peptidase PulO-like enzyme (type II secretory pathway)